MENTTQKKVMDWIDTQDIVEAIEGALEVAELPKTKANFKEVWLLHLQDLWGMLENDAVYLKELREAGKKPRE